MIRRLLARIRGDALPGARCSDEAELHPGVGLSVGPRTVVREGAVLDARLGQLELGPDGFVGPGVTIRGPVRIGADALIAAGVVMEARPSAPIEVGDDVWIGLRARIGPGIRIGRGAVVGAGAWVDADVPAGAVVVGRPAHVHARRGVA